MIYTAKHNNGKNIFVFGSNKAGIHGAGAAKTALEQWGAQWGKGEGRTGMAYALPTKDKNIQTLCLNEVALAVERFKGYALSHPEFMFLVTAVGCGLAGYEPEDIAPMFEDCPPNCILPDEFLKCLS